MWCKHAPSDSMFETVDIMWTYVQIILESKNILLISFFQVIQTLLDFNGITCVIHVSAMSIHSAYCLHKAQDKINPLIKTIIKLKHSLYYIARSIHSEIQPLNC